MNESEFSKQITSYLDRGSGGLRAGTVYRLQLARQQALASLEQSATAPQLTLAGAGGADIGRVSSSGPFRLLDARLWIGIALIVASVLCYQYWQSARQARDIEDTDTAILSSDLPIEAYLDRGFQAWLTHSEP